MEKAKKVEIVIDSIHLNHLLEKLQKVGVSGYSVFKDVIGMGERGMMAGDELTDVFKNSYIFTLCDEETTNKVVEAIRPILKKYGGICTVSDVLWVK
jgi:nitrogen regulatory protein PII